MKQIFVDGNYDYDYSVEATEGGMVHILFRSNNETWTSHVRGEEALSITDNGNGFVFNHGRPKKEMDYSDAFELSVLLKILIYNDHKVEISNKEIL